MESTTLGTNRTGAARAAEGTRAMMEATAALAPVTTLDVSALAGERTRAIREADAVGSIPPPSSVAGMVKNGIAKMMGGHPTLLVDKMGERLAFERSGTRLYDAFITKHEVLDADGKGLPAAAAAAAGGAALAGESARQTLMRIRNQELAHFRMLTEEIEALGGDPTCQTPCADVTATASLGFVQVLSDPRTTLAQCLNTLLGAELIDTAGWELLIEIADDAGQSGLVDRFRSALDEEEQHTAIVRSWLRALCADGVGTKAV